MSAVTEADNYEMDAAFLAAHNTIEALAARESAVRAAVVKLHQARGRYHTHLAYCELCDLFDLPATKPERKK